MLLRVILALMGFAVCSTFSGCSLPLSIDDDALRVSGGIVPPATTTQRANSHFQRQDIEPSDEMTTADGATSLAEGEEQEVILDGMPPKNFRPLIP